MSGSILEYEGQEAYWAALCAMEGIEYSDQIPSPSDAEHEISEVWEFVEGCCIEFDIKTPSKKEAIQHLRDLIAKYVEDNS